MNSGPSKLFLEVLDELKRSFLNKHIDMDSLSFESTPKVTRLFHRVSLAIDGGKWLDMKHVTSGGCNTTHCIAGWVVDIAGQYGSDLSDYIGWANSSNLIMAASCPWLERLPNYYSDDETAMKFIESMLAEEMAYYALPR